MNSKLLRGLTKGATVLAVAATVFVAGCSDDDEDTFTLEKPGELDFRNDVGEVELRWGSSASDGDTEFAGYYVYKSTETMSGLEADEIDAFRITSSPVEPGDFNYTDSAAAAGTRYYYVVRGVDTNGNVSTPTNEVSSASVLSGNVIEFGEFASPDPSGIDLSAGMAVSMMVANAAMVDFYLGTADDTATGNLVLKSPDLVSDDSAWKSARFLELESDDVSFAASTSFTALSIDLGPDDEIDGKVIAVRLEEEGGGIHYGKLEVLAFDEDTQGRSLSIDWTYQPIAGFARF